MNMKKFICGLLGLVCAGISIACLISGIRVLDSPGGDMYGIAILVSLHYFAGTVVALYGSVILLSLSYGTAKRNTLLLTSGLSYLLCAGSLAIGIAISAEIIFRGSALSLFDGAIYAGSFLLAYGFWKLGNYLRKRAAA